MKYNLSVDIDKRRITLVRVAPGDKDKPPIVRCTATYPILPDSSDNEISQTIKAILKENNIREKEVVIIASASARNNNAFFGKFYLPVMPPSEIRSAVMWEARSSMPFDPRAAIFKYQIEEKARDRYGVEKIVIFIEAIKIGEARRLTDIVTKAGLIPVGLLHPISTIASLLKKSKLSGTTILLDVDNTVSLLIYRDGKFEFEKKIDTGEDSLDRTLAKAGVAEEEFSTLKNEYGLLSAQDLSRLSLLELPLGTQEIRIFADELAVKIRRALKQWIEEQGEEVVEKVYLIGSLARVRNLAPYLATKLKIDVLIGDADSLGIELSYPEGMATPDLSLLVPAIGGSSKEEIKMGFLPPELKIQRKLAQVKTGIRISLSLILVSILLLSFYAHLHALTLRRTVAAHRAEIAGIGAGRIEDVALEGKKEELTRKLTHYHSVVGYYHPIWASTLRELTNITPAGILFRELRLDGAENSLFINGVVIQLERGISPYKVLDLFIERITHSPFFIDASLVSSDNYTGRDARGMSARSFSLRVTVRPLPTEVFR